MSEAWDALPEEARMAIEMLRTENVQLKARLETAQQEQRLKGVWGMKLPSKEKIGEVQDFVDAWAERLQPQVPEKIKPGTVGYEREEIQGCLIALKRMVDECELTNLVIGQIYKAVERLGGKSDILAAIGSWRDTMSDEDTLRALEEWNKAELKGYDTPSILYKPRLSIDDNQWCALYGENLQDGVAGFGDSPAQAVAAFDKAWVEKLPK